MSTPVLYVPVGEDGSITLPVELREALGVQAGDEVALSLDEGRRRLAIEPRGRDLRTLFGMLSHYARPEAPLTVEAMDDAIAEFVAADDARIRRGDGG